MFTAVTYNKVGFFDVYVYICVYVDMCILYIYLYIMYINGIN